MYIYSPREEETDDAGREQDVARFYFLFLFF